jgi:hypothetical protein
VQRLQQSFSASSLIVEKGLFLYLRAQEIPSPYSLQTPLQVSRTAREAAGWLQIRAKNGVC